MHWTDYDGDIPYGDFDITPNSFARTEVTRYFGLAGQQAVGDGAETYYHADQIGSTMATSDAAGAIRGQSGGSGGGDFAPVVYTAFGEFLTASGVAGCDPPAGHPRYAYAGAFGYETGGFGGDDRLLWRDGANPNLPPITLQHVGWRWYQPEIGRFVQRDPIGIAGGLNEYSYVMNAPTLSVDPSGLHTEARSDIWKDMYKQTVKGMFAGWIASGFNPEGAILGGAAALFGISCYYLIESLPPLPDESASPPMWPRNGYPWGPIDRPKPGEHVPPYAGPKVGGEQSGGPSRWY